MIKNRAGDLGPLPPRPEPSADLSRPQSAVLAAVEHQAPATLAQLAETTGLHLNTVREHLDRLLEQGLVRRESAAPSGRGRPAWLYRPVPRLGSAVAEYSGLAAALASAIHRTSTDPHADAVRAGEDWGRDLASRKGRPTDQGDDVDRRRRTTEIFQDMGFEPEHDQDHAELRLTRCPLLAAALVHPDVVCGVHLGIARGALATYGLDREAADLQPFAEPGACLLRLDGPTETDR